jgi:hypothetical protein
VLSVFGDCECANHVLVDESVSVGTRGEKTTISTAMKLAAAVLRADDVEECAAVVTVTFVDSTVLARMLGLKTTLRRASAMILEMSFMTEGVS